ncbi:fluoride efflux transporter CrcB [soil metagenome]
MKFIVAVGIGSLIGGISRYLLTQYVQEKFFSSFPYGTFTVNVLGCLLIGIVFGFAERDTLGTVWKLFLITGILGGFTTFSSFSNETVFLLRNGKAMVALLNVLGSVVLGVLATFAGLYISKLL